MTEDVRLKISQAMEGKKHSLEHNVKISKGVKGKTAGSKHYNYKGGRKMYDVVYNSFQYADWRKSVFVRDNFTCVICKTKSKRLNADHILPKCLYPEKMFDLDNGRTLCVDCHKLTNTYCVNKRWMIAH